MVRWWIIGWTLLCLAGCQWAGLRSEPADTPSVENYAYVLEGSPLSTVLFNQLVRWISYSGGKQVDDPAQAMLAIEIISDQMKDRTISVNALGQPLMCEKTAKLTYRVSRLPDRESSTILTATTSMLYRRENDRETSLEYQAARLHEKLSEDISRYVSLQLTAWNRQYAIDHR